MPVATAFIRIFAALLLSIPFFFAATYYLAATAADQTLLDPEFVADSFRRSDLYQRIYGEVFLREQYADWTDALIGGVEANDENKVRLLREVTPPPYIQGETERSVAELTGYFRGEDDDLDLFVDLSGPLDNAGPVALGYLDRRIGALDPAPATPAEELSTEVADFLASVAGGQVPDTLPTADPLTPEERARAYRRATEILGEEQRVSSAALEALESEEPVILPAVREGDMRSALRSAGRAVAGPHVEESVGRVRAATDARGRLDLIQQVALDSDRTQSQVRRDAAILRFLVQAATGVAAQWTALAVAALCLLLIAAIFIPYWKHVVLWPSITLVVFGLLLLLTALSAVMDGTYWQAVVCRGELRDPCGLTVDISRNMVAGFSTLFVQQAMWVMVAGFLGVAVSLIVSRFVGRKWS